MFPSLEMTSASFSTGHVASGRFSGTSGPARASIASVSPRGTAFCFYFFAFSAVAFFSFFAFFASAMDF